jgi:N-acetylglutamate synthase-like GNAT family acetyltransferase
MWDALHASMRHWYRLIGAGSEGARVLERDGVVAALVPASPERSVINSVVYAKAADLASAYDEVASAYDEIGAAWTVWVHEGDADTTALLEENGHVLDASPVAMATDLVAHPPQRPADGELPPFTANGSLADVGAINDRAYPFGGDTFSRAFNRVEDGLVHMYVAHEDGQPVACSAATDCATNTEVQMVAVVPEARGRGLAGKLIAHSLADAVERGAQTGTLVASKLGYPVYEKVGFAPLGVLEMWERRGEQG